eukprot:m.166457 g.166457  ORF g.166457 m.166457 type:complete len:160 (+) comp12691_c0_seq1:1869-2348(+)
MPKGKEAADKEELDMLRSTRSSLTAFHLLLRKLNEDLATMADNYRKLTAANEEWRRIADSVTAAPIQGAAGEEAAGPSGDAMVATAAAAPTAEQRRFLRDKLVTLFAAHRDGVVGVQSLLDQLEEARPGFVPQDQVTAVLESMADANDIMMAGDAIMRI